MVTLLRVAGASDCAPLAITSQPQSQVVLENCSGNFFVSVRGTGPYSYQWFRDDHPVPAATNGSYTMTPVSLADNGARIYAIISNDCSKAISLEVQLYVSLDVVPPRVLRSRGDSSLERVIVTFGVGGCVGGPGLDPSSAQEPFNYSLTGGIIVSNALLEPNGTNLILTTSRQVPDTLYTLTIQNVRDRSGNCIPPASQTTFPSWVMVAGSNPPKIVPPSVIQTRSGSDIWITWPNGSFLQVATDLRGPRHTLLNADYPYAVTVEEPAQFYRALFDP